jgi:uncharacterized protein (UPF0332 family)
VKPETALFLEKSHELLERADTMMGVGLTDDAGRAAYLAGLHAAQVFIFETTEGVLKRHSGVQREFSRLVKDDPRVETGLRTFLSRTYQLKAIADYLTGPGSHVSAETARGDPDRAAACRMCRGSAPAERADPGAHTGTRPLR